MTESRFFCPDKIISISLALNLRPHEVRESTYTLCYPAVTCDTNSKIVKKAFPDIHTNHQIHRYPFISVPNIVTFFLYKSWFMFIIMTLLFRFTSSYKTFPYCYLMIVRKWRFWTVLELEMNCFELSILKSLFVNIIKLNYFKKTISISLKF